MYSLQYAVAHLSASLHQRPLMAVSVVACPPNLGHLHQLHCHNLQQLRFSACRCLDRPAQGRFTELVTQGVPCRKNFRLFLSLECPNICRQLRHSLGLAQIMCDLQCLAVVFRSPLVATSNHYEILTDC